MQESSLEELKVKGWNQMHSILDKEMPQKKKDRRLPFFWLLVGMLLGIGTFYVYNRFLNQIESENRIAIKTSAITSNESQFQSDEFTSNSNNHDNNSTFNNHQNSISSNSKSSTSSINNTSINTLSLSLVSLNSSKSSSEKLKLRSISKNSNSKIAEDDNTHSNNSVLNSNSKSRSFDKVILDNILESTNISNNVSFQTHTNTEDINDNFKNSVNSIFSQEYSNSSNQLLIHLEELGLNIKLLKYKAKSNIILPGLHVRSIKSIDMKSIRAYNIMLASNVNINSWTKHLSYDIGLYQQYHFLQKLSITLGTKYEYARSTNDLINCAIFHFPENNDLLANNRGEVFTSPMNKNYPNYDKIFNIEKSAKYVTSVQSLNIPLRLNYHFNSHWSAGLGAEYSLLLNKNAMKLDSFTYTCLINDKTTNFDYIRIRNKEFRYSASLAFKLNSKININCDASYYRDRYDYSAIFIPSPTGMPWPLSDINYKRNFFNVGIGVQYKI